MWRASRNVEAADCLVVRQVHYLPPRGSTGVVEWALVLFAFGNEDAREVSILQDQPSFAAGVAAGSRTFEVLPAWLEGFVAPVTLELERGTVVLVGVWPRIERWLGRRSPSVRVRVLPSALSGGGWWEARWRRRLGWEDLNSPHLPEAS